MCKYFNFYFGFEKCTHKSYSEQVVLCDKVKRAKAAEAVKETEAAQAAKPATGNCPETKESRATPKCRETNMRARPQVQFGRCFPGTCHDCTGYKPARWDPFAMWLEDLGHKEVDTEEVLKDIWGGIDPEKVLWTLQETRHYHYDKTPPDTGCCVIL